MLVCHLGHLPSLTLDEFSMAAELKDLLVYRKDVDEHSSASANANPTDAVLFFGISLCLGIACRHALRGTRVPYTVSLLIVGIVLGSLEHGARHQLGRLADGIHLWANINPDLLLAVFLPALLYESSFSLNVHQIKRCLAQMLLLAGPGVVISTLSLGFALKLTFPHNWSWKTSLLLGGLLSATDPVAVVALLRDLGASKKLSTIIEGESLMNDGTAIVVYQLLYRMVMGESSNVGVIMKFLTQVTLGAVGIGLAFGIVSVLWLGFIFNDLVIEIALSLAVSYVAYFTAQEGAVVSGVLAVMSLGMFCAAFAKTAFTGNSQHSLHVFWEMIAYIANTLIFILSGVVIAEDVLSSGSSLLDHGTPWGFLILLYLFVQLSRLVVVGVLFPFLCCVGYGLNWQEAVVLIWSGLRGAVSLSLALSVQRNSNSSSHITSETGTFFVFYTGGIVFLTLVVNGSTTQYIIRLLGLDKLSAAKKRMLDHTRHEMLNRSVEVFRDLGDDEELGPADWPTISGFITSLNVIAEPQVHPHLDMSNLKDIRARLLNGVQAAYWVMLDEGRLTPSTADILVQSVDEAIDLVSHEPLCDWRGLQATVYIPPYYKYFPMCFFTAKLITFFVVQRLESSCYICAAFLRAHRIAERKLLEFIGGSDITYMVIEESKAEGEEARKFLEEVRVIFPQVLRIVKTRQVAYAVLTHLLEYVHGLEKIGLLEEKEMLLLRNAVQSELKKLLRNPPMVEVPKMADLINSHPLLGSLPPSTRETLEHHGRETLKLRGFQIYKEGSLPDGIWLICNGVVKWSSKRMKNKWSLHPRFTHGSTLGLYEMLSGQPYLCDIITDSVVICFFIKRGSIVSLMRSDPLVEDFLWRESVIILAKLLLPQIFEEMALQMLRVVIGECSSMSLYTMGEIIEVPSHCIGILLEGLIRAHDEREELIEPPAVLLPPHASQIFQKVELFGSKSAGFSHRGMKYSVNKRSRVILFDMAAVEADHAVQRKPSPLTSQTIEHPHRHLSKEHGDLMRWPEAFHQMQQNPTPGRVSRSENCLSARAMQLSFFGSMKVGRQSNGPTLFNQFERSRSLPFASARSEEGEDGPWKKHTGSSQWKGKAPASAPERSRTTHNRSSQSVTENEFQVVIDSLSHLPLQLPTY